MIFCSNCGKSLVKNAKFCSECGSNIEESKQIERKISYDGEILKCPQCGEVLKSFESTCPACSHELRNLKSSSAVQELSQKLDHIECERKRPTFGMALLNKLGNKIDSTDERKISLITNFPVPNTKEDIREFLIMASANKKAFNNTPKEMALAKAWKNKYKQVKKKASLVFDKYEFRQLKKLLK